MSDRDVRLRLRAEVDESALQRARQGLDAVNSAMLESSSAAQQSGQALAQQKQQLVDVGAAAQQTAQQVERVAQGTQQAQQGVAGLRSALETLGLGNIPIVGDFLSFADSLPSLRSAISELPQTVMGAAAQIGVAGGLAGAALVALALAVGEFQRQAQEQADLLNSILNQQRSVLDEIAGGATSQQIEQQIERLRFRRELEARLLAESEQAYENFLRGIRERFGLLSGLVEGLVRIFDSREEALAQQIDRSRQLIQDSEQRERAYQQALQQGLTRRNDAATSEQQLSAARNQAISASNDASRSTSNLSASVRQVAPASASASGALNMLSNAVDSTAQRAAQALSALRNARQQAATSLGRDLGELTRRGQQQEADLRQRGLDQALAQERAFQDRIAQLRRNAQRQEQDAIRNRDFLALDRLVQQTRDEQSEQQIAFEQQRREAQLQQQQQLRDLQTSLAREREQRLIAFSRQLSDAQSAYARDLQQAARAGGARAQIAAQSAQAELEINRQFYQQRAALAQAGSGAASSAPTSALTQSPFTPRAGVAAGIVRRPAGTVNNTFNISAAQDVRAIEQSIVRALGQVGLV